MKYYWDNKDLRKDLKELEKRLKLEKNPKEQELLAYYIATTKQIILSLEDEDLKEEQEISIAYLSQIVPSFLLYYPYIEKYNKIANKKELPDLNSFENDTKKNKLSKDALIELIHEFYRSTNLEIYDKFQEIYRKRHHIIYFSQEEYAYMQFIPGINKPYFTLNEPSGKDYKLSLMEATHEIAHGIASLISPERYTFDELSFFTEIESMFFELVAIDFFSKQLNDDGFYKDELMVLKSQDLASQRILIYRDLADYRFKLKNPSQEEFLEQIKEEAIRNMLTMEDKENFEEDLKYLFSYIVAIELSEIYRKDKNSALEMLKEILKRKDSEGEYENITKIVTPGKSLAKFRKRIYNQAIKKT